MIMAIKRTVGDLDVITLENDRLSASFLSLGARWISLTFEGKELLLGYDTPEEYRTDACYIGATVGRVAGRIRGARVSINGKTYFLDQNEKVLHCHHGGFHGLHQKNWVTEICEENTVSFSTFSRDGEGGFPGGLRVSVNYSMDKNTVTITTRATTTKDTFFSPTNHAYFNLDGFDGEDAREMMLELSAEHYLPVDEELIPTGEIRSVEQTIYDFRRKRRIQSEYDLSFVLGNTRKMRRAGKLYSPDSRIAMELFTDMPALQLYTCNSFRADQGRGGIPLHPHQGVAMETHFYPNSPSTPHFPSCLLKEGETFESTTKFIFNKE